MVYPNLDQSRLLKFKDAIRNCQKCSGKDLSCSCYRNYFYELAKIKANIPIKFRDFNLKKIVLPELQRIVKMITKYIENLDKHRKKGTGLYLWGNPGTAKTALASIILMEALKKGYECYVINTEQYMSLIVDKTQEDLLTNILNVDFLLLEDVGREYRDSKGLIESKLDELIRFRTDNLLPTIITTNKDAQTLSENNLRFLSILQEHFIFIAFSTKDYRKKIGIDLHEEEK